MRILPTGLVAGMSGVVSWIEAVLERFNLVSRTKFNVLDAEYGADNTGVLDSQPAFADAYLDAKAVDGGKVVIPAGTYRIESDLDWDSHLVAVEGAGSTCTILQLIGTAQINAKPATLVGEDAGAVFRGFTVLGDPSSPGAAIGIYSGDIVGAEFDDILIRGFNGAGSIGLHLDNAAFWCELNKFGIRFDDCSIDVRCSVSGGNNSFARNDWHVHFGLHEDQIGFQATDNALIYAQGGRWNGNAIGDNAVFIDMLDDAAISGPLDVEFETTGAFTGVVGLREASVSFQWYCSGTHNYSESITPDRAGGWDLLSLPLGLRIREGAANARMGAVTLVGGTATVNTTAAKDAGAGQRIVLARQAGAFNSPRGFLEVGTRTGGVSFVINSTDDMGFLVADVSVIGWWIFDNWDS